MKHLQMSEPIEVLKDFLLKNNLPYNETINEQFKIYIKLLQETPHNVTAIRDPLEIVVKHFIDSLFLLKYYKKFRSGLKIIDIGTGAGFPGMPLKIIFPEVELYLVESVKKKTDFLRVLIDKLNISGIIILRERAEILAHDINFRERFKLVLSRAVAPLPILLEISSSFIEIGGNFIAYKGEDVKGEIKEAQKALKVFNLIVKDIYFYTLPIIDHRRSLVFFEKTKEIANRYPRRPGIPQKRPLK